jgi:NSS family neurotransmitter:Na+ symporter
MATQTREQWSSRTGFVLAAVGSAVGLGNMWRFSYLTAENGGAAFVLLYVAMTALIGLPVLLAEFAVGRGARRSPIQALVHFGGGAWRPLGVLFVASGFLILSYYSVIAGWTLRYALGALVHGFGAGAAQRFGEVATGADAFGFHLLFMAITAAIVAGGIKRGIERTAMVLMPTLFVVVGGLAIYAATLDGAAAGYRYYLEADFSEILSFEVLHQATGQAFFSLSLGMGAMLTFASYLSREHHLPNESIVVGGADFIIAFVAGLMVFPLLFALGLSAEVSESTVGALFITLPSAFGEMGAAGRVVGFVFFVALVVGALTSAISLLEVVVASTIDALDWPRPRAAVVMGGLIALLGIPSALSTDVLGVIDGLANNVLLISGALALSIFVGWVMPDPIEEVAEGAAGVRWFFLWRTLLRFVVPAVLAIILVLGLPSTFESVASLFRGG